MPEPSSAADLLARAVPLDPPVFLGDTRQRAVAAFVHFDSLLAPLRADLVIAAQLIDEPGTREWVHSSAAMAEAAFPDVVEHLRVNAELLDVDIDTLFLAQHRALFPLAEVASPVSTSFAEQAGQSDPEEDDPDGCSVGAARLPGEGGGWIVKNRDNAPGRHIVAYHSDPAWGGRGVLAMSNAGSILSASGGINTNGFSIVSTATRVHRPAEGGIYRTILMSGLLSRCDSVDEALEIIGSLRHLGGTVTLADAQGAIANVELEPDAITIERAGARPWIAKTNHACSRSVLPEREAAKPEYIENSQQRLGRMQQNLDGATRLPQEWDVIEPWIVERMTTHDGPGAVCRHEGRSPTIATSIYRCNPPSVLTSEGPGCEGAWRRWDAREAPIV